ncbi:MAG: hypothetical protein GY868_16825, partial [Deltaproteobacteria bacterium]|nr:hypothetical protein [Deltaproteobacteria bacterium]
LAPYCFPLAAMALLGATLLLPQTYESYMYVMLGVSLGYYLVSRLGVFREEQPDLKEAGLLFSLVFCLFANILTLGFIIAVVSGGFKGGGEFLAGGAQEVLSLAGVVCERLGVL